MQQMIKAEKTIDQAIHTTAENALALRPAIANVVRPFSVIFSRKAQCISRLVASVLPDHPPVAHDRLLTGIPVLAALSWQPLHDHLDLAAGFMLPAIEEAFPALSQDVGRFTTAWQESNLSLVSLAEEYLDGSFNHYEPAALSIGVSSDVLGFIMHTMLSALLGSLAPAIGAEIGDAAWSKGYCPICGSLPSVSFLARPAGDASEFLKDSGGRKYLHCALCGHNWHINRHICPVCDNPDKDLRMYLTVPEQSGERVDVCLKCKLYLPCLDLREQDTHPHLDMAAVCMAHLDILARKKGFTPVSMLPWNQI